MDSKTCASHIAADLHALGISTGETILVHSSFKSLGQVPGGIETVIQGLLEAIGPDGTLILPALTWSLRPPEVFDARTTPTIVGAIPEYFRTRSGASRSIHPTHSVCAVGPRTQELLNDHILDSTPCGIHSPFRLMAETNGKIVMLGCGLTPNTTMHAIEEIADVPYVLGESYRFTLIDLDGRRFENVYRTHGFSNHGVSQRYERVEELEFGAFLRRGKVLESDTYVMDAPKLAEAAVRRMKVDPWFFVERTV